MGTECNHIGLEIQHLLPAQEMEDTDKENVSFSFRKLSGSKKIILYCMMAAGFGANIVLSIPASFLPKEAHSRGVNTTTVGWIFGVLSLTECLVALVVGTYVFPKTGSKVGFVGGLSVSAFCIIIFGFMGFVTDKTTFVVSCILIRILNAIGSGTYETASFVIIAEEFPEAITSVFGYCETFCGIGGIIGPALGGFLYEAGGFMAPFAVLGIILLAFVPISLCVLPPKKSSTDETIPLTSILKFPLVWMIASGVFILAMAWASLDPTLEPRERELGFSAFQVGLMFLCLALSFALTSPIVGKICENLPNLSSKINMVIISFIFIGLSLLIIGPSPLIVPDTSIHYVIMDLVGLIFLGIFIASGSVPTYEIMMDVCLDNGFEDNIALYSTLGGLWGSMYALGEFVGPVVGGFLIDSVGFQWTMTVMAFLCVVPGLLLAAYSYVQKNQSKNFQIKDNGVKKLHVV